MNDRRVYEEISTLVEEHHGSMKFEKEGYRWGAWIIKVEGTERIFLSSGSGFPELDQLYMPKNGVTNPSHWSDYSNSLIPSAWEKLMQLLSE